MDWFGIWNHIGILWQEEIFPMETAMSADLPHTLNGKKPVLEYTLNHRQWTKSWLSGQGLGKDSLEDWEQEDLE